MKQAADQHNPGAQGNLGQCYLRGVGVEADPPRAKGLFLEAAEKGDAHAANSLGDCYKVPAPARAVRSSGAFDRRTRVCYPGIFTRQPFGLRGAQQPQLAGFEPGCGVDLPRSVACALASQVGGCVDSHSQSLPGCSSNPTAGCFQRLSSDDPPGPLVARVVHARGRSARGLWVANLRPRLGGHDDKGFVPQTHYL